MIDLSVIRDGLARGEFFLQYLPVIDLSDDDKCIGAEALIRWRRADGVVSPGQFIPLVENTPLSGLITYFVMDTVQAELGDWLRANPDAYISVNIPPEILGRGGIEYVASRSGLSKLASQVMLEITERGVPDQIGVESIDQARALGVRIALDDVTLVGGAKMAILARSPFDAIKLAKSLLDQISPAGPSPEWLTSLKVLAEASPLVVIAEGVETEYQVARLRAAGIEVVQGFYYSRPIPAGAFVAYHRDRNAQ